MQFHFAKNTVLGDIHGNWVALQEVAKQLDDIGVDVVIGVGDYLYTSLGSPKVVEWMKAQPHSYWVRGDNDAWSDYERYVSRATYDPIDEYEYVTRLPERMIVSFSGVNILVQHGYDHSPLKRFGWENDRIKEVMSYDYVSSVVDLTGIDIALFGDIHKSFIDAQGKAVVIHPGSLGVPFDREPWMAKFVLLELQDTGVQISHHRVPFSIDQTIADVQRAHKGNLGDDSPLSRILLGSTPDHDWAPTFDTLYWSKSA